MIVMCLQLGAVSAFAQTLRRYTSLNHLAQAARAVLQNTSQINQMLTDLNRVDFANVQVGLWLQSVWSVWAPVKCLCSCSLMCLKTDSCIVVCGIADTAWKSGTSLGSKLWLLSGD